MRKGEPVAGLANSAGSIALALLDERGGFRGEDETDAMVLGAVERSIANGNHVLLQVIDSSKLGWRAPSERCLDEISARWAGSSPGRRRCLPDAARPAAAADLSRPRIYRDRPLARSFFTGPAFSGALLVPAHLAATINAVAEIPPGLSDYSSRSDWPKPLAEFAIAPAGAGEFRPVAALGGRAGGNPALLSRARSIQAFGPGDVRRGRGANHRNLAVASTGAAAAKGRRRWGRRRGTGAADDLSVCDPESRSASCRCRNAGRSIAALARDAVLANTTDPEIAARPCLVGQPVALGRVSPDPVAALRISAGARLVTEAWSADAGCRAGECTAPDRRCRCDRCQDRVVARAHGRN